MVCAMIEKRRIICGQESDGDEGIREKKERKTEPEVLLVGERVVRGGSLQDRAKWMRLIRNIDPA